MKPFYCNRKEEKKTLRPEINPPYWAIEKNFNFYINNIRPLVLEFGTQKIEGIHGLDTHTNAVVFRGIDFALSLGENPVPVIFACAFHDMARINDDIDPEHGKRAVPMAMKIMKEFPELLTTEDRTKILSAIVKHTDGGVGLDYISNCLWDADRVRMSWNYGFDQRFFNTARGAYVASNYYLKYIEFQKRCIPGYHWSKQY